MIMKKNRVDNVCIVELSVIQQYINPNYGKELGIITPQ